MTASPFRTRTAVALAAVLATSLVAFLLWAVFGAELWSEPSAGADSYSRSALGHAAFVETLRALGVPVETSRAHTAEKASRASLLVIAEPDLTEGGGARIGSLRRMLGTRCPVLLVLPKWRIADRDPVGQVTLVEPVPSWNVLAILHEVDPDLSYVRRPLPPAAWDSAAELGAAPTISRPQLLRPSKAADPLLSTPEGDVLAAVIHPREGDAGGDVTVLSDPDVIETHGLHRGDNALLAARLVDRARRSQAPVLLDETLHGHEYDASVFRELFRWPLATALLQALLAAAVWLWAGMGRFGAPGKPPPAIEPGKRFLVESTADLLHRGGHGGHVLGRYLASAVQDVARATQAPPGISGAALSEWLAQVGEARGVAADLPGLRRRVDAARAAGPREPFGLVAAAMAVHGWRKEMTHGSGRDS